MNEKELLNIWKLYDQKLDELLTINKQMASDISKQKLNRTIGSLQLPKKFLLILGTPYTFLLYFITFIGYNANAFFVMLGFGIISLIMTGVIVSYGYHLYLISQIKRTQNILEVQTKLARLKLSSFNVARLAIIQLPFWSICWMSLDALQHSPLVYGGVNLILFLGLSYVTYWLYKELNRQDSKVSQIFLSGMEWEPILKASSILEQMKEYRML